MAWEIRRGVTGLRLARAPPRISLGIHAALGSLQVGFAFKSQESYLDVVSTTCGSGWVDMRYSYRF